MNDGSIEFTLYAETGNTGIVNCQCNVEVVRSQDKIRKILLCPSPTPTHPHLKNHTEIESQRTDWRIFLYYYLILRPALAWHSRQVPVNSSQSSSRQTFYWNQIKTWHDVTRLSISQKKKKPFSLKTHLYILYHISYITQFMGSMFYFILYRSDIV